LLDEEFKNTKIVGHNVTLARELANLRANQSLTKVKNINFRIILNLLKNWQKNIL
jgi:hypothetical protein